MRFDKKRMVCLLAIVLVLGALAGPVSAVIYDYQDSYPIPEGLITQYAWTNLYPCQLKIDDTSMYLLYQGNQEEVAVRAMGCTDSNGSGMINKSYNYGQYVAFYICEQDTPYRIVNRVWEDGYRYCTLGFFPKDFNGTVGGDWFPVLQTTNYYFPEIGAYE